MALTCGIALGSWWAYYELGWGGFWFWDPVENASLMPWLIATALLHSALATEKSGAFRTWTLLLAIAGPVIAGTSLFGGRGSVWTALLGAMVIGSISNGMDLLALSSAVKFMVTGGVLLLAVIVDALARQKRSASGRV